MPAEISSLIIEPLAEHHSRGAFCCDNEIIDSFMNQRALKDHNDNKVRVRVAVENGSPIVLGFYSLSLKTLAAKSIQGRIGNKFGKWPIPAVYLSMIATDKNKQKMGIGSTMMYHVFRRTLEIADIAGTACLALEAVDEEKASWYESLSFKRFNPDELGMYIPLATVRAACDAAEG